MSEAEMKKLDRIASRYRGPRTRAENLRRHLDNLDLGITRSPVRCVDCGAGPDDEHRDSCIFGKATS